MMLWIILNGGENVLHISKEAIQILDGDFNFPEILDDLMKERIDIRLSRSISRAFSLSISDQ